MRRVWSQLILILSLGCLLAHANAGMSAALFRFGDSKSVSSTAVSDALTGLGVAFDTYTNARPSSISLSSYQLIVLEVSMGGSLNSDDFAAIQSARTASGAKVILIGCSGDSTFVYGLRTLLATAHPISGWAGAKSPVLTLEDSKHPLARNLSAITLASVTSTCYAPGDIDARTAYTFSNGYSAVLSKATDDAPEPMTFIFSLSTRFTQNDLRTLIRNAINLKKADASPPTQPVLLLHYATQAPSELNNFRAALASSTSFNYFYLADFNDLSSPTFLTYRTIIITMNAYAPNNMAAFKNWFNKGIRVIFIGGISNQVTLASLKDYVLVEASYNSWNNAPTYTKERPGEFNENPLVKGLPDKFTLSGGSYAIGASDPEIRVGLRNNHGVPALFAKSIGKEGVLVFFVGVPDQIVKTVNDTKITAQILKNAIKITPADCEFRRNSILVYQRATGSFPSVHFESLQAALKKYSKSYDLLGVHNGPSIQIAEPTMYNYSTIIFTMKGGEFAPGDGERLRKYVARGGKIIFMGGSTSSPSELKPFLDMTSAPLTWSKSPKAIKWEIATDFLASELPSDYFDFGEGNYVYPIDNSISSRIALRNRNGIPVLLSKDIGNGVFVYLASPSSDWSPSPIDPNYYRILMNAITLFKSGGYLRPKTLVVEFSSSPISYMIAESAVNKVSSSYDFLINSNNLLNTLDYSKYRNIIFLAYGIPTYVTFQPAAITSLKQAINSGSRVIMAGDAASDSWRSLIKAFSNVTFLRDWTLSNPSLNCNAKTGLDTGVSSPHTFSNAAASKFLTVYPTTASQACTTSNGSPALFGKRYSSGSLVTYVYSLADQHLDVSDVPVVEQIIANMMNAVIH